MKKNITLFCLFLISAPFAFGQSMLEFNEIDDHRQKKCEIECTKIENDSTLNSSQKAAAKAEEQKKTLPILALGSNLTTGTDAIGFRPVMMAGTKIAKKRLFMQTSINFTTVDDQKFSVEKTGQTLFIHEISNFSAQIGGIVGLWNETDWATSTDTHNYRLGIGFDMRFRGNSLFNLDSTTFKSEQNDISTVAGRVGVDCILIKEYISIYCNFNYMSVTNNRNAYHNYFPDNAIKDFWYFQPGFRFTAGEDSGEYKVSPRPTTRKI